MECEERACSEWLLCDPEVGVCVDLHISHFKQQKEGGATRASAARSRRSAANAKITTFFHPKERKIHPHFLIVFLCLLLLTDSQQPVRYKVCLSQAPDDEGRPAGEWTKIILLFHTADDFDQYGGYRFLCVTF